MAKLNQQLLPQVSDAHKIRLLRHSLQFMIEATFSNPNSSYNKEIQLRKQVQSWKRNHLIRYLISENKRRKSLKTTKMQACMGLSEKLFDSHIQKMKRTLMRLACHGLLANRMMNVNILMERKLKMTGLEEIKTESERVAVKQRLVQRAINSSKLKRLKNYFKELKTNWQQVKNLNQLGMMFYKMQGQMAAKKILSNWTKFTFRSEKSLFHKGILAKDFQRNCQKKKIMKRWREHSNSGKKRKLAISSKIASADNKLLKLAFRSLAVSALQSRHRKRSEILNKVMKAWRREVVRVIEDRAIDAIVNEQDKKSEIEAFEEKETKKKKNRNERFMWLLMGKDAPAALGRFEGLKKKHDGDLTDANHTEFSSEDLAGEDIAIKSAL